MAIMNYETPNITKIEFEDNLFVTTEFDSYDNKEIKGYIESRGGVVKSSITKTTNYLIYEDKKEESSKYKKALDLVLNKGAKITILSRKSFEDLVTMKYKTPDVSKINFYNNTFVLTGSWYRSDEDAKYIERRGGIVKETVTEETNYLIYSDGQKETENYLKAMSLVQQKDAEITILPFGYFQNLILMTYETPDISECLIKGKQYVATGFNSNEIKDFRRYIGKCGGLITDSVTEDTDYLIYQDKVVFNSDKWETEDYAKALSLAREGNSHIVILPYSTFTRLNHRQWDIEFGSYPFDEDGGTKPVRWTILKWDGNKALLLSTYGLDVKPYNNVKPYDKTNENATWETCSLRKWLNEYFYNHAFTDEEKKKILLTKINTPNNPRYLTSGGNDTEDKIFLLSIDEAKDCLTEVERITRATPYAAEQILSGNDNGNSWWLRSPGRHASRVSLVSSSGIIDDQGNFVYYDVNTVCPAMWVELE